MMTRRDFENIAESVRLVEMDQGTRDLLVSHLSSDCASSNPRFDRAKFKIACQPKD